MGSEMCIRDRRDNLPRSQHQTAVCGNPAKGRMGLPIGTQRRPLPTHRRIRTLRLGLHQRQRANSKRRANRKMELPQKLQQRASPHRSIQTLRRRPYSRSGATLVPPLSPNCRLSTRICGAVGTIWTEEPNIHCRTGVSVLRIPHLCLYNRNKIANSMTRIYLFLSLIHI